MRLFPKYGRKAELQAVCVGQTELKKLITGLRKAIKENKTKEFLIKNPKSILVLRIALGLSQATFIQKLKRKISQVALIRHEKGRSKHINKLLVKELIKYIPDKLDDKSILKTYKKFEQMKKGLHMTSERARKLNKIWVNKTSKTQRKAWGRMGAIKTNTQLKLTFQEKQVKKILDSFHFRYEIHNQIETKLLDMNIDFIILEKNKPKCFIEVTDRRHDLAIVCQAYAYRCRLLKEKYPNVKVGIIINNIPLFIEKILQNEFDFVIDSSSIKNLNRLLQF